MKGKEMTLIDWQKQYGTEEGCAQALIERRWPEGFRCPCCGHDGGYSIKTRGYWECSQCHKQTSLTAGTLFHSTNLPLTKWFWAIYLVASDKGGISALRLSKQINVSWITASRMLRKIRIAMGHRDSIYRLHELIEIDDALIGGRHAGGKRGRGAEGKTSVLVAIENREKRAGFIAMQQVSGVNGETVSQFVKRHLSPDQCVRSDALPSLAEIGKTQNHTARVTPPDKAGEWLP
ncbi:ISXO2-like transposase domain-containing protein [Nitrosomonas sp. Nm51]|nr:ISXO2-like transposase domain-containing protein [Nitrosomonas sp. Nm51]